MRICLAIDMEQWCTFISEKAHTLMRIWFLVTIIALPIAFWRSWRNITRNRENHNKYDPLLREAVYLGYLPAIKVIMGIVEYTPREIVKILPTIVVCNYVDIVVYLFERYNELYGFGEYLACLAASHGRIEIIDYLVAKGYDIHAEDERVLSNAIRCGKMETVDHLLAEYNCDLNAVRVYNAPMFYVAFNKRNLTAVKFIVRECGHDIRQHGNWLIQACEKGQVDFVEYFLSIGMDPNYQYGGPLMSACRRGELNIARYLVSKGARPAARGVMYNAARSGSLPMVKYMRSLGATCEHFGINDWWTVYLGPINVFLYLTQDEKGYFVWYVVNECKSFSVEPKESYDARLALLVGFIKQEFVIDGEAPGGLYDSNLGMLVCSYMD